MVGDEVAGDRQVGGADEPHVGRQQRLAAQALELAVLHRTQDLGLAGAAHVGDFVEEEGAPVGLLELPLDPLDGAGEGALLMAEELAVEERVAQRRRVEGDEGSGGTARGVVNRAGQHRLAGAGLAQDEDGQVGPGGDAGQVEAGRHRLVVALEVVEGVAPVGVAGRR